MRLRFDFASRSLRARLLSAFILLVILSAGIIGLVVTVVDLQTANARAADDLNAVATIRQMQVEDWLHSLHNALNAILAHSGLDDNAVTVASRRTGTPAYAAAYEHLRGDFDRVLVKETGLFKRVLLLDLDGRVVLSTDASQEGAEMKGAPFFAGAFEGPFVEPLSFSPARQETVMYIAHPLADDKGNRIAIVAAEPNLALLDQAMAKPIDLGQSIESYLVGPDYALLAPSTAASAAHGPVSARPRGEPVNLLVPRSENLSYTNYAGVPVVGLSHPLPELGATLITEVSQAEAFESVVRAVQVDVGITLGMIALAVALALLLVRTITAPLAELSATAAQIESGNVNVTARVGRPDEIGQLAGVFNRMTARLRQLIVDLQHKVVELETAQQEQRRLMDAIKTREEQFRSVAELASEAIILVDGTGRIVFWNHAAENLFGYPKGEALGRDLTLLASPELWETWRQSFEQASLPGAAPSGESSIEFVARRKDGRPIPIELSLSAWKGPEGMYVTIILRDIAKRKWAQSVTESYIKNLQFLTRSATRFLEKMSYAQVLAFLARELSGLAENALVLVGEYHAHTRELVVRASGGDGIRLRHLAALLGQPLFGLSLAPRGEAALKSEDRFIKLEAGLCDLGLASLSSEACDEIARRLEIGGVFLMPLAVEQELLGAAVLLTREALLPPYMTVTETLVRQAAVALKTRLVEAQLRQARAELEQRVEERTQELARANQELRTEMAERLAAEQRVERLYKAEREAHEIAETLRTASQALTRSLDLDTVLGTLLEHLGHLVPYDTAHILLPRTESQFIVRATGAAGGMAPEAGSTPTMIDVQNSALLARVLAERKSALITDTLLEPELQKLAGTSGRCCWLAVPLIAGGNTIGLCVMSRVEPDTFAAEQVQLVEALAGQTAVAVQNAWLFEQVSTGRERLQALSRRLVEFQEAERRYISRELHDETGQLLTGLKVGLSVLERVSATPAQVAAHIGELRILVDEALENLHRLALRFRPATLDQLGLVAALNDHVQALAEKHALRIELETVGFDGRRLPPVVETALYRIVQEALTNIIRHARASRVQIILDWSGDCVTATVDDDGVGFDVAQAMQSGRLGLIGMQERVEMLGGRLTVESEPGEGTTVVAEVPCADPNPDRG